MSPAPANNDGDFLALGLTGESRAWRYLLGMVVSFVATVLFSCLLFALFGDPPPTSFGGYLMLNVPFAAWLLVIFLWITRVQKRHWRTVVTSSQSVRWRLFLFSFVLWYLIANFLVFFEYLAYPDTFEWAFQPGVFFAQLPFALLLTPIQTSTEEVFFRGWFLQFLAKYFRNPWILSTLLGLFFVLPHALNPEFVSNPICFGLGIFAVGFMTTFITIRTGGIELAMGFHAANNLMFLIFDVEGTTLRFASIFHVNELHHVAATLESVLGAGIFYFLAMKLYRRFDDDSGGKAIVRDSDSQAN